MKKITVLGILLISIFSFSTKAEINFDLTAVGGTQVVDYAYASTENAKQQDERWITMNVNSGTAGRCDVPTTFDIKAGRPIEFHLAKCDEMIITANVAAARSLVITINGGEPIKMAGTGSCNDFVVPINQESPVVIKVEGEGGSTWTSLFTFKYSPKIPQITSFIINGVAADIDEENQTIKLELPYGTDITNVTPEVQIGGTAASYNPTGAQDFSSGSIVYNAVGALPPIPRPYTVTVTVRATPDTDKAITDLTINGKTATIDEASGAITYEFPSFEGPLGNWPVEFTLNSITATADFVSGTNYDFGTNNTLTIKVTAQDESTKTYTVKPTVSTKKNVAILTVNGKAESYDDLFLSALSDYYITFLKAETTAPDDIQAFYANYDLIVLHANVGGTNATGVATKSLVGVKPILNMKAFFYNSGRWGWSSANPGNATAGTTSVDVPLQYQNHPIFANVTFDGTTLTYYDNLPETNGNSVQFANDLETLTSASHTLATYNETGINIHEIQENSAAKFLLLGLSMENNNYTYFNNNTLNIIKNAAAYLLSLTTKYDYTASGVVENKLSSVYFDGNIIYNPEQLNLRIFNTAGVNFMVSKDANIDVSTLPKGVYIIQFNNSTQKIIK
ncbi:MAG: T9SS type A sorting domain-containing protein [Porphyromonadaceae bacterium]|nr:T9SS type A sorting domain-containing protein [Porphyromonadaceae bacterium]